MAFPHMVAMGGGTGKAEIHLDCHSCEEPQTLVVGAENYLAWRKGAYIQDALAELSPDQREMLISGICPQCWAKMFPPEE